MIGQTGIGNPADLVVPLKELHNQHGIGHMSLHAQAQGLYSLHCQPTVERRGRNPQITHHLYAGLQNKSRRTQAAVDQSVVGGVGLGKTGEPAGVPVELASIDQQTAQAGAMAVEKLGGAVGDDVGTPLKRSAKEGGCQGVVDNQRQVVCLGNGADLLQGKDNQGGIANGLTVDQLGVGPDSTEKRIRLEWVGKADFYAQTRQSIAQLVVGAAIETAAGDDMVACSAEGEKGQRLGTMAAAGGQSADAALQVGNSLFQNIGGRIHDPGVDVAKLFQGKQVGRMRGIFKQIRCGLIQRNSPAACGRINGLAGVELAGRKPESTLLICHDAALKKNIQKTFEPAGQRAIKEPLPGVSHLPSLLPCARTATIQV